MRSPNTINTVVIADDDYLIRRIIKHTLKDLAIIVEVSDGADVEEVCTIHKPDIIFLDIHIPHLSGEKLVHRIIETDPEAYIVMLSGDSSIKYVTGTLNDGAKIFLRKPFNRERLLSTFNNCPTIQNASCPPLKPRPRGPLKFR